MLKEGIEAQYEGNEAPTPARDGVGRVAKRKANYAAAIGERSEWQDRLDHLDLDEVAATPPRRPLRRREVPERERFCHPRRQQTLRAPAHGRGPVASGPQKRVALAPAVEDGGVAEDLDARRGDPAPEEQEQVRRSCPGRRRRPSSWAAGPGQAVGGRR